MNHQSKYQLIGPFSQFLDLADLPQRGALKDDNLNVLTQGAVLVKEGRVHEIGKFSTLYQKTKDLGVEIIEIEGEQTGLPGWVDMHTHICFAGSRANDYAMRNAGKSYLEIAKTGGGIWDTVTQTRKANQAELKQGILKRSRQLLQNGITTIEVKSGYGLSVEEELKMLRAIKEANEMTKADLVSTCLAAHILPKDFDGNHADYLREISTELFPRLQSEKLTNRIDAFIEEEAFSSEVINPYFEKAKSLGFDLTVHADQFHPGGSEVAIKFGALSADHLEASTEREIELLAKSQVIATALPGASIGLGCAFTPARKLLDAGACLAIASDWNPGSAPMGDLLTQAAILGTFQKLTNAELLAGITFRAAAALKLFDRGRLQPGFLADIISFPTNNYQEIFYQQGQLKPAMVWKKGELVIEN